MVSIAPECSRVFCHRDKYSKPTIWQSFGICRRYSYVRITAMVWAHLLTGRRLARNTTLVATTFLACGWDFYTTLFFHNKCRKQRQKPWGNIFINAISTLGCVVWYLLLCHVPGKRYGRFGGPRGYEVGTWIRYVRQGTACDGSEHIPLLWTQYERSWIQVLQIKIVQVNS